MPDGIFGKMAQIGRALQTAGKLVSPPGSDPSRSYKIVMTLHVRAANKRELEAAVKNAKKKLERVGYDVVGSVIGVGNSVKLDDLEIEIGKEEKNDGTEEAQA